MHSLEEDKADWMDDWRDRLIKWLETEELGSPLVVDRDWDTVKNEDGSILADSYSTPFDVRLDLIEDENKKYLDITIYTPIATAMLDEDKKRYLYQTMLRINNSSRLLKFGLENIDDEIIVEADFDLASLNKKEFDDGLRSIIEGCTIFFSNFLDSKILQKYYDEEKWKDYEFYYVVNELMTDLDSDEISKDTAVKRLQDIGYEEERAEDLIGRIDSLLGQGQPQSRVKKNKDGGPFV